MDTLEEALNAIATDEQAENPTRLAAALRQAVGAFVSVVATGGSDELRSLAKQLFRALPERRTAPPPIAYVTALETLAIAAHRLYEIMAPKATAVQLAQQPRVARALQYLNVHGRVRARNLRPILGIEHQPNLARLMRKLAEGGLVTIDRGEDNGAWYNLTFSGRRLMRGQHSSELRDHHRPEGPPMSVRRRIMETPTVTPRWPIPHRIPFRSEFVMREKNAYLSAPTKFRVASNKLAQKDFLITKRETFGHKLDYTQRLGA
jgi:hypothetical protein